MGKIKPGTKKLIYFFVGLLGFLLGFVAPFVWIWTGWIISSTDSFFWKLLMFMALLSSPAEVFAAAVWKLIGAGPINTDSPVLLPVWVVVAMLNAAIYVLVAAGIMKLVKRFWAKG